MIKKICLFAFLVFNFIFLPAQTLVVKNSLNNQPVENVALYNKNKTVSLYTNSKGIASLDRFNPGDSIFFQHPSFEKVVYTRQMLQDLGLVISLKRKIWMLDEFVISASKWEQNIREIPNKITILRNIDIAFNNPQTVADLLACSNEVFIQKSQLGGGSPMIRGFSTNSILLVIDGVRMNNAIYRSGNLQNVISLDPHIIENTEVIFGPGSVIYGSDALGGVMDFHTKRALLSTGGKKHFSLNAFTRYSSANKENTGHLDFNIGSEKLASLTSISFSKYDDLKMGTKKHPDYQRYEYSKRINNIDSVFKNPDPNIQKFSGYSQINLTQKIRFRPNEHLDINYSFHLSQLSDVPRYDRLIQYKNNLLKYAQWYYGPQKWTMHSINATYDNHNPLFDALQFTVAYQQYEESRHDRKFGKEEIRHRTEKVNAFTLNLDMDKKINEKQGFYYGFEFVLNDVNSTAENENILTSVILPGATRYPDGDNKYITTAGYTHYKNNFNDFFTFNTGIRFNYINLNSTLINNSFYNFPYDNISLNTMALNGSAGLVYRPDEEWQVNLNLSSGFRAPNIDDVAKIFDSEPGNVMVPNNNLKPEYAYNIDLGVVRNFMDKFHFELTGFYTFLRNAMVRRDFAFNQQDSIMYDDLLSKVQAVVNASSATLYGVNLNLNAEIQKNLSFKTNLSYTFGQDVDNIPLRHVAPLFGSTHIIFNNRLLHVDLFANYNGEKPFDKLALSEQSKTYMYASDNNGNPFSPAWYTLNLKTSFRWNNNFIVFAGIENILDHRYRPYSSGIVAPGRNFTISLKYTI
ncbi:MAG: TonB-dependent receptor [Bacteroidales bacterium]|nr:TonB-dependent receptor [Bacteroidales bacterium]